jgi:hypothetical protein
VAISRPWMRRVGIDVGLNDAWSQLFFPNARQLESPDRPDRDGRTVSPPGRVGRTGFGAAPAAGPGPAPACPPPGPRSRGRRPPGRPAAGARRAAPRPAPAGPPARPPDRTPRTDGTRNPGRVVDPVRLRARSFTFVPYGSSGRPSGSNPGCAGPTPRPNPLPYSRLCQGADRRPREDHPPKPAMRRRRAPIPAGSSSP